MMSDYEHIRCPQDIGFENIFPQEECEVRKFYGDCYHCWNSSIAKRSQEIRADERRRIIRKIMNYINNHKENETSEFWNFLFTLEDEKESEE